MSAASALAQRLRVFRYVKAWMEENGECPSATQVARETGVPRRSVMRHMDALRTADGLPFRIPPGGKRRRAYLAGLSNRVNVRADLLVPVDSAMRHSRRSRMMDALEIGWDGE